LWALWAIISGLKNRLMAVIANIAARTTSDTSNIADHAMGLPVLRTLSLCTCRRHLHGAHSSRTSRTSEKCHERHSRHEQNNTQFLIISPPPIS
jgi:hypothetical protein